MKNAPDMATIAINAQKLDKLTKFITAVAPYAMDKKEQGKGKGNGKTEDTAKGNLGKMIKLKQA